MSGWGCPHEQNKKCGKVAGRPCDPGMKGCVLAGRFVFANQDKNNIPAPRRKLPPRRAKDDKDE